MTYSELSDIYTRHHLPGANFDSSRQIGLELGLSERIAKRLTIWRARARVGGDGGGIVATIEVCWDATGPDWHRSVLCSDGTRFDIGSGTPTSRAIAQALEGAMNAPKPRCDSPPPSAA